MRTCNVLGIHRVTYMGPGWAIDQSHRPERPWPTVGRELRFSTVHGISRQAVQDWNSGPLSAPCRTVIRCSLKFWPSCLHFELKEGESKRVPDPSATPQICFFCLTGQKATGSAHLQSVDSNNKNETTGEEEEATTYVCARALVHGDSTCVVCSRRAAESTNYHETREDLEKQQLWPAAHLSRSSLLKLQGLGWEGMRCSC